MKYFKNNKKNSNELSIFRKKIIVFFDNENEISNFVKSTKKKFKIAKFSKSKIYILKANKKKNTFRNI